MMISRGSGSPLTPVDQPDALPLRYFRATERMPQRREVKRQLQGFGPSAKE